MRARRPGDPPEHPAPVTPPRIAAALATRGYVTQTANGTVSGAWDGYDVEIRLLHSGSRPGGPDDGADDAAGPALLALEAKWGHTVPPRARAAVHLALNDWNRQQLWPIGTLIEAEDGWTASARFVVDVADGLADHQLLVTLDIALRGSIALLKALGTPESPEESG